MESNKENVKVEERSRIPVLKERKAPRLTNRQDTPSNKISQSRDPLKTLSHLNIENSLAGPSHGGKVLDMRYVTCRNKDEDLDWKFDVFKDKDKSDSKPKISDVKIIKRNQLDTQSCSNAKTTPVCMPKTATAINELKKVKRSLKRPSSSKIVACAPVSAKACHCSISSSSDIQLNCASQHCDWYLKRGYALDNLNYLLHIEKKLSREPNIRRASRSCVINWIINVNGANGNPAVVQLACWYLDNYLINTWISVDQLQVIAAACFWIANKIHGHNISSHRLVKYSGNAFIEKELVFAERNILEKLQFQVMSVVAHDFVPYLAWCCDPSSSGLVEAAAVFLCQCGIMINRNLYIEYPSVLATAAVKNALILLRQHALIDKLKTCSVYKLAEKKASNLKSTCAELREAVRVVSSVGYEYKAPLFKFSGPPYYISNKIVRAVNYKDIWGLDTK